jgi:hypothetical protein
MDSLIERLKEVDIEVERRGAIFMVMNVPGTPRIEACSRYITLKFLNKATSYRSSWSEVIFETRENANPNDVAERCVEYLSQMISDKLIDRYIK